MTVFYITSDYLFDINTFFYHPNVYLQMLNEIFSFFSMTHILDSSTSFFLNWSWFFTSCSFVFVVVFMTGLFHGINRFIMWLPLLWYQNYSFEELCCTFWPSFSFVFYFHFFLAFVLLLLCFYLVHAIWENRFFFPSGAFFSKMGSISKKLQKRGKSYQLGMTSYAEVVPNWHDFDTSTWICHVNLKSCQFGMTLSTSFLYIK